MTTRKPHELSDHPQDESPQVDIEIEYDRDVIDGFRALGQGWQQRMNDVLRAYLKEHPLNIRRDLH